MIKLNKLCGAALLATTLFFAVNTEAQTLGRGKGIGQSGLAGC